MKVSLWVFYALGDEMMMMVGSGPDRNEMLRLTEAVGRELGMVL